MLAYELFGVTYPSVSEGTVLHLLLIDLPLAMVLVGPLLFIMPKLSKASNPGGIVPAVIVSVLGASSLYALFDSHAILESIPAAAAAEITRHQRELENLGVNAFAAAIILFAAGLLLRRLLSRPLSRSVKWVAVAVFGVIYICSSVWLVSTAHVGASLADHLAEHAHP